jgi:hypothetical protein
MCRHYLTELVGHFVAMPGTQAGGLEIGVATVVDCGRFSQGLFMKIVTLGSILSLFAPLAFPQIQIPRVWDDAVIADLEVPLSHPQYSPKHVSAEFYYKIPVRSIWKSYPVYQPGRAPAGYMEWLKSVEPKEIWSSAELKTEEDWVRAGEMVFDAPIKSGSLGVRPPSVLSYLEDEAWFEKVRPPVSSEGSVPFYRYVIRKKGTIEIGILSCAMCHTRVMPDGSVIKGAQGNFPFDRAMAQDFAAGADVPFLGKINQSLLRLLYFSPWMTDTQPALWTGSFDPGSVVASLSGRLPGSMTRHRSSPAYPIQIPDLIGVQDRRYLDRTGLQQSRDLADLMRYAALNQGGDDLAAFGDFIPAAAFTGARPLPDQSSRYSDEQLYALAKYVTSLRRPPNPNAIDAAAKRGQRIFEREGCNQCHTPPLYTNNRLTPAAGFRVPEEHRRKYDILPVVVGTDPGLTMETRRGTGYYKVPSLLGVWYRGAFEHSGRVPTLEDWFDLRRLRDDYRPADDAKPRAVMGHEFGLKLSPQDKKELIAFLRTL